MCICFILGKYTCRCTCQYTSIFCWLEIGANQVYDVVIIYPRHRRKDLIASGRLAQPMAVVVLRHLIDSF